MASMALMAAGGLLALYGLYTVLGPAAASAHWPSVEGVINTTEVVEREKRDGAYLYGVLVDYRYDVNGIPFTGTRVRFGSDGSFSRNRSAAESLAARYPAGKILPVYHDRQDPSSSVLEPGRSSDAWGLCAAGATMVAVGWALRRRAAARLSRDSA